MATAYFPRSAALPADGRRAKPTLFRRVFAMGVQFFEQLQVKRERQRTIIELSRLSDHTLEDIGLRRADIGAAADTLTNGNTISSKS